MMLQLDELKNLMTKVEQEEPIRQHTRMLSDGADARLLLLPTGHYYAELPLAAQV